MECIGPPRVNVCDFSRRCLQQLEQFLHCCTAKILELEALDLKRLQIRKCTTNSPFGEEDVASSDVAQPRRTVGSEYGIQNRGAPSLAYRIRIDHANVGTTVRRPGESRGPESHSCTHTDHDSAILRCVLGAFLLSLLTAVVTRHACLAPKVQVRACGRGCGGMAERWSEQRNVCALVDQKLFGVDLDRMELATGRVGRFAWAARSWRIAAWPM